MIDVNLFFNFIQKYPQESVWTGLVAARFALQLWDIQKDYPPLTFDNWQIKHDERCYAVPQARNMFLKDRQRIYDYYPSVVGIDSGIFGQLLAFFGFKVFGLNNLALRLPYVIIGNLWLGLAGLSIMHIAPGIIGISIALLLLLNYNFFLLTRCAILDSIFILHLSLLAAIYIFKHDAFVSNLHVAGFISAALVLVRGYFAGFSFVFIGLAALVERIEFGEWLRLIIYSASGIIIFGSIVLAVFWRWGLLSEHIHYALKVYRTLMGKKEGHFIGNTKAVGADVAREYFKTLLDWFINKHNSRLDYFVIGLFFLTVPVLFLIDTQSITKTLVLYILIYMSIQYFSWFHGKRILITLLAALILFAALSQDILLFLSSYMPAAVIPNLFLGLFWTATLIYMLISQYPVVKSAVADRSDAVRENSKILDQCIPEGTAVYMSCFSFRAMWQSQRRLISIDDSHADNQIILDKAFKEGAKYVALDDRWGDIDYKSLGRLNLIHIFRVSDVDIDVAMNVYVYEILAGNQTNDVNLPFVEILSGLQKSLKAVNSAEINEDKLPEFLKGLEGYAEDLLEIDMDENTLDIPFASKIVYNTASALKSHGMFGTASKLFDLLVRKLTPKYDRNMLACAYFHLGEIKKEANDVKIAKGYFKTCLNLMPEHRKARLYLKRGIKHE